MIGVYVVAVVIVFWYFYPILAAKVIPYSEWYSHMWYKRLDLTGRNGAAVSRGGPARLASEVPFRIR